MMRKIILVAVAPFGLFACAGSGNPSGTLAELAEIPADIDDVYVEDSLEQAALSYRRYLNETTESARTPEAMRRLADLQIEQAYGVIGSGDIREMAAPDGGSQTQKITAGRDSQPVREPSESEQDFETRATERAQLLAATADFDPEMPGGETVSVPVGPAEAIKTYWSILEKYPNYERNDQVLYQLSRAYDEVGEPDQAMAVMDRVVAEYPYSRYLDEVYFRRGEYYFVRKKYLDAEDAYGAVIRNGSGSSYYELALYKLGWSLYKQELYEEALHNYMAMLDHRLSIGYDFNAENEDDEEHRLADTFRVISLSFSNLGGPEVVDEYFASNGQRVYADKIYGNLGEFYFSKLRFEDAASVYKSFLALNPLHRSSPHFGMRIVEIYGEAGFPLLVVEAKKDFARNYALDSEYWDVHAVEDATEVVGFLKLNLTDLAGHYHALYQEQSLVDERPANFSEAQGWYRQFLASFNADEEAPQVHYQLADLLLENEDFGDAAAEYERIAYEYGPHDKASAAGYAAIFSHREHLKIATGAEQRTVMSRTVDSSLQFADTFPDHEQAPTVLGHAADNLYEMKDLPLAIESARKLINRYPTAEQDLVRSAWAVVANASMDLNEFVDAENAYSSVIALTADDDEKLPAVIDGLAAAIYKQGEQANLLENYQLAAEHFLRIKKVAPTSSIRSGAEYDAAVALMKLQDWMHASGVLEEFRTSHPEHELATEATKQLAHIYREDGQVERSAAEHERIAAEASDPEMSREALLIAGDLYDKAGVMTDAIRVYTQYVTEYPRPLDVAMETRTRIAEIHKAEADYELYYAELESLIEIDGTAGAERTDRSRYLAAQAALVLAELNYERFASLELKQPFEQSLATKQQSMDEALKSLESLVDYEVGDVTAAATFYIAEIYLNFSAALMNSERPAGLTDAERVDYELVIEEEAYPFEERAISVHEANFELLVGGLYNPWVQKSLDKLTNLMPGRYAKNEISGGYLGSIDMYAYRMPIVPEEALPEATAQLSTPASDSQ